MTNISRRRIIHKLHGIHRKHSWREKVENIILYALTGFLVLLSVFLDGGKTKQAFKKAWKAFEKILPQLLGVVALVGLVLAFFEPITISSLIGSSSGWWGIILASTIGAITLIPGFIAFPMAALLLQNGAGYGQIGAFVSSLMMVGIVTLPMEIKYFGEKTALLRNGLAFLYSFFVAFIIGRTVG